MDKSSQQSVERLAQILPLDIKLDKTLILTFINIIRRPDSFKLKNIINTLLADSKHLDHRILTPIHKYIMAKRNLMDFDPESIEPHITETMQDITRRPPTLVEMKSVFGKSGDRTSEQAAAAKQDALKYVDSIGSSVLIYTDGSALGNPGPTGSGAAIYLNGALQEPITACRPVSSCSTSYHGELQAIDLAITELLEVTPPINRQIHLLSDCQSALKVVASPTVPADHNHLHHEIQVKTESLRAQGAELTLKWIAGHIMLDGNDLADTKAKAAAMEAKKTQVKHSHLSLKEAKCRLQRKALHRWQQKCSFQPDSNVLLPPVSTKSLKSHLPRKSETRIFRLITGNTKLQAHMNKLYPQQYPSPQCECGEGTGDRHHYLLDCSFHNNERELMMNTIDAGFHKLKTPTHLRSITLQQLLGPNLDLQQDTRKMISKAVSTFLLSTSSTEV
jgi:ribonuclease HI